MQPQRPNFDNMRKQINGGITVATGINYVKQCEDYALSLEKALNIVAPGQVENDTKTPPAKDTAPAAKVFAKTEVVQYVDRAAFVELAERVSALEAQRSADQHI